jgi:putative phosphoesterase
MKAGLIGDIHANLPALEAVFAHAASKGVQLFWNIGDFVGYNAFPEESVQFIRQRPEVTSIIGNYDLKVLKIEKKREKWAATKAPEKLLSFEWTYDQLSEESKLYLRSLPEQREFSFEGWNILLTHGSPASREEHLLPDTPDDRLRELAEMTKARVIIFGHSHVPFARMAAGKWFINTGSVGRPDDGDPRAAYAILRVEGDELEITHFRVPYDVERAVEAIRRAGLPEDFAQMIRQGRNLDSIKKQDAGRSGEGETL